LTLEQVFSMSVFEYRLWVAHFNLKDG